MNKLYLASLSVVVLLQSSSLMAYNLETLPSELESFRGRHAELSQLKKDFDEAKTTYDSVAKSSTASEAEKESAKKAFKPKKVGFKLGKAEAHLDDVTALLAEGSETQMNAYLGWTIEFYKGRLAKAEKKKPDANWTEEKIQGKLGKLNGVLDKMNAAKSGDLAAKQTYFKMREEAISFRIAKKSKAS